MQKQSNDIYEHVLTPLYNLFTGNNPALNASRAAAAEAAARVANHETGDHILRAALGGLGLGLSGTRLYHMIGELNKPKETYTKFGPGAKKLDDNEKLAATLADTLKELYNNAAQGIGGAVNSLDSSFKTPAVLGTAGLGLLGGSQLINSIEAKKRKEEQAEMVEDAKKEYQRALMGKKHAAAFDAAFAHFAEKSALTAVDTINYPLQLLRQLPYDVGDAAAAAYATGTLGAGALAGKMTYDWTRARGKDKALEKARKSRARIEGAAPLYIDPEQLAAIKKIAD